MRQTATRGVKQIGPGLYLVRVKWKDAKTARWREVHQRVPAPTAMVAKAEGVRLARERAEGRLPQVVARVRFEAAATSWLRSVAADLKRSTLSTYATALDAWIGEVGEMMLDAIEPRDVRAALAKWQREGLKAPTRNGRLRVLRTFAKAQKCATMVEGVEAAREHKAKKALSVEELRLYLRAIPKHGGWWAPLLTFLAWTGARFGEASALRRIEDFDLSRGMFRVTRAQYRGEIDATKTEAGERESALPKPLVKILVAHRAKLLRMQGPAAASDLMFPSKAGTLATQRRVWEASRRVAKAAGIDLAGRPALHFTRHTFHNLLRQTTTAEVRQAMIGHAGDESGEAYTEIAASEKARAAGKVVALVRAR